MNRLPLTMAILAMSLTAGLALAADADARAGGGFHSSGGNHSFSSGHSYSSGHHYTGYHYGGSHGGSGVGGDVSGWPFVFFGAGFLLLTYLFKPKEEPLGGSAERVEVSQLVPRAAERDPVWVEADLLQQAKDAFMAVQNAWMKRDQDLAKDVMTSALYARHFQQTEAMRERGELNLLEQVSIRAARIVHVADHADDAKDEVWIRFVAQAIDYTVDERTTRVIKGSMSAPEVFAEVWVFKRRGDAWLADEIKPPEAPVPRSFVEA